MNFVRSLLIILLTVISLSLSAQKNNANYRAIKKIERLKKREKFEDAGIRMRKILNIYPVSKILWDDYIKITLFNYAKKIKNDAPDLIVQNSLYTHYNAVYYANMSVPFNSRASSILRGLYVDKIYFTKKSVDEQSLEIFEKAELEMDAQNYQSAIELYEKSYALDTNNCSDFIGLGRAHS